MGSDYSIKRLKLTNFQCHPVVDLELDPLITTITGPSDSGKSAILRALRWITFNRPRGDGFIRHGETQASASVLLGDGTGVKRERSKKFNGYLIKPSGKPAERYQAMGTGVPESVDSLLDLGPENFAGQHDAPFWFSLTAGEVAKELNRIVDLSIIDSAQGHAAKSLRDANSRAQLTTERLEKAQEEAGDFEWVGDADEALAELEEECGDLDALDGRLRLFREMVYSYVEKSEQARQMAQQLRQATSIKECGATAREMQSSINELTDLVRHAEQYKTLIDIELPDFEPIAEQMAQAGRLADDEYEFAICVEEVEEAVRVRVSAVDELAEAINTMAEETAGLCPLCGGPME